MAVLHDHATAGPDLTSEQVWRALGRASFAVLGHVTPQGRPRSSGVVFAADGHRLYVVTAPDSWKARQIATGDEVAMTVTVRRGGLLTLVAPIPPATVSFHAVVTVHAPGTLDADSLPPKLVRLLPRDRRSATVLELEPVGRFSTYGIGVSLTAMADPDRARGHAPVG